MAIVDHAQPVQRPQRVNRADVEADFVHRRIGHQLHQRQCGHGATAGDLDEDLLFYLRARGIPQKEAEALLIQAFIGEAVEGVEHARLREVLMDAAVKWLRERG
jgi:hypothetical protein